MKAGVQFSVVLTKNRPVTRAIAAIPEDAWIPVHYPGAVLDPDTGELISDAEVAEVDLHRVRLHQAPGHRPADRAPGPRPRQATSCSRSGATTRSSPTATEPTAAADITHRRHAIIETVFADLIDGPWPTCPRAGSPPTAPGRSARRSPTTCSAPPAPSTGRSPAVARGATLRRQIVTVPARLARPQRRRVLHLPAHWPWAEHWLALWNGVFAVATGPPATA